MVEVLTEATKRFVLNVQDYFELAGQSLTNLATSPRYFQDVLDQMDDIGVGSLAIVLMYGFFIGAVMVLQTGSQFVRFGQTGLTGDSSAWPMAILCLLGLAAVIGVSLVVVRAIGG